MRTSAQRSAVYTELTAGLTPGANFSRSYMAAGTVSLSGVMECRSDDVCATVEERPLKGRDQRTK
jgi:hypothetical protein